MHLDLIPPLSCIDACVIVTHLPLPSPPQHSPELLESSCIAHTDVESLNFFHFLFSTDISFPYCWIKASLSATFILEAGEGGTMMLYPNDLGSSGRPTSTLWGFPHKSIGFTADLWRILKLYVCCRASRSMADVAPIYIRHSTCISVLWPTDLLTMLFVCI